MNYLHSEGVALKQVFLTVLLLAGCNQPDPRICGSGLASKSVGIAGAQNTLEQYGVALGCVEHWSARLATGKDTASEVAAATLGACAEAFDYEAKLAAEENVEPTIREFWYGRALFIAVQTRAGNCYPDA